MRKSVLAPAGLVAAVALLTVGTPTASQAFTQKELSICYDTTTPNSSLDLEVVADGPSFKTASLDDGDCVAWDVRPGEYKITLEDLNELAATGPEDFACADKTTPIMRINVKRMGDVYKQHGPAVGANGGFETTVRRDRLTAITFLVRCEQL